MLQTKNGPLSLVVFKKVMNVILLVHITRLMTTSKYLGHLSDSVDLKNYLLMKRQNMINITKTDKLNDKPDRINA